MRRRTFNPTFWSLAQLGSRVRYIPTIARQLTTIRLPAPTSVTIPTRHGMVRAVIVRPVPVAAGVTAPPVVLQLHGGGFLNRYPEQDLHMARFMAANIGAVVVLPDYGTAPKVRYPVAEEQMYDVARWVQTADDQGWDGSSLLLSGISAGSKLAINICQQLHSAGEPRPIAVSLVVPVTDMSRTDRTSAIPRPAISPFVQRLVSWAYFPDVDRRREPLAAPRFDTGLASAMPATLIQTAEHDTLAAEGRDLAVALDEGGVETRYREYAQADHGFYSEKPVERVSELLTTIAAFFTAKLNARDAMPTPENSAAAEEEPKPRSRYRPIL